MWKSLGKILCWYILHCLQSAGDVFPHISFTLDIDVAVCWRSLTAWQMLQGPCCLWINTLRCINVGGRLFQGSGKESKCPGLQRERASEFITKVHQLVALMNFQVAKAAKCAVPCSNQGDLQLFFSHVSLS